VTKVFSNLNRLIPPKICIAVTSFSSSQSAALYLRVWWILWVSQRSCRCACGSTVHITLQVRVLFLSYLYLSMLVLYKQRVST